MQLKKYILLILITVALLSPLRFSHKRLQQDDYYHIRSAQMMREHGIYRQFPWAKHTVLNEHYYDLHFLYHVLLIPFTFGNLIITGKIASIIIAATSAVLFYWFLRKNNISYAFFWTLMLLFSSSQMLTRMLAIRPISLSIIFFIVGTYLLFNKKYHWLLLLGYLFVLAYNGFPILLVIVVVYTLCYLFYYKKLELKPLLYCIAGMVMGLIINPYVPNNFRVLFVQLVRGPLTRATLELNLEWLPLSSWALFLSTWGTLIALFAVFFLSLKYKQKQSFNTIFLFIQSVVFLISYLKYSRGVDQFVPYAVLFCAFSFSGLRIKPARVISIVISCFLIVNIGVNMYIVRNIFKTSDRLDNSGSAEWLKANTQEGSEVFIANYGAFPQLFFYNTHNVYTLGLDPIFMREHDRRLYHLYQDAIWLRKDPYPIIKGEFNARYIHVENVDRSRGFYNYLNTNPGLYRKVYQDDFSAVFELSPTR